jgi:AraC-like DNA-binding protein
VQHARTFVPTGVPYASLLRAGARAWLRARPGWTRALPWTPFAAALFIYGAAGAAGTTPPALELWMAIAKAISLTVCVAIAVVTIVRVRHADAACDAPARRAPWVDLGVVIGMVTLGLATLPAALVGGEALARWVHDVAVLPVLALVLWGLAYLRLRARPGSPTGSAAQPSLASPAVAAARRVPGSDDEILAAVYAAFVARLDAEGDWQDADFGLDDAAARLGLGRHLLSEAINRHVDGGFTALVNRYRIAAFRAALATAADDEPVLAIGLRCGFGSKASLQRLVRQHCGCSPGALRNAIRAAHRTG